MLFKPKVESLKQARELFFNKYFFGNEEKKNFVLEKWNELILIQLTEFIAKKDAINFFQLASSYYFPPSGKAVDLAEKFSNEFLFLITTPNQAMSILKHSNSYRESRFSLIIEDRWKHVSNLEIKKAEDIESLKILGPFIHSSLYKVYFLKLCYCCDSIEGIREINNIAYRLISCGHSDIREIIDKKIDAILFDNIPDIFDIETIKEYYNIAPSKSVTKIMAFEKWLELCETPEEANEAYQNVPNGKTACYLEAYKRAKELNPLK